MLGFHRGMLSPVRLALSAAAVAIAVTNSANADVSFGATYSGAGNNFTASLGGGANFTVGGSGSLSLSSPPILGTPVGLLSAGVNLPSQTVTIGTNTNINTSPTGSATLVMQDVYSGQNANGQNPPFAPPGPDGKADEGNVIDSQMSGRIDNLNVNFVNNLSVGVNGVTLSGSATFNSFPFNVVGGVTVPISLALTPSVILQNLNFTQVGIGNMSGQNAINPGFADGAHPGNFSVQSAQNLSTQYSGILGGYNAAGPISGSAAASVGAVFSADLGIFGSFTQNLGSFDVFGGSIGQDFGLLGNAQFIEIATATNSTQFDALLQTLAFNLSSFGPLSLPVTLSGSIPINQVFNIPLSLGFLGTLTFPGTFSGSVSYTLNGTITLTNLTYALQSQQIANAVNVPEASSLALMALTTLGGVGYARIRRRRSC